MIQTQKYCEKCPASFTNNICNNIFGTPVSDTLEDQVLAYISKE